MNTRALVVSVQHFVCLGVALGAKRDLYGVGGDEGTRFRQLKRSPFNVCASAFLQFSWHFTPSLEAVALLG